jgi:hypothetical protein
VPQWPDVSSNGGGREVFKADILRKEGLGESDVEKPNSIDFFSPVVVRWAKSTPGSGEFKRSGGLAPIQQFLERSLSAFVLPSIPVAGCEVERD